MGLREEEFQQKILYLPPMSDGQGEYQERNLGRPVKEVSGSEFIQRVFGQFDGHLCVFQKQSNGIPRQKFAKKNELDKVWSWLERTFGTDTYVSYSTYFRVWKKAKSKEKVRTQKNIVHTYMLVQDLDYYKNGTTDSEALAYIRKLIDTNEIICPTFIVSTGRGYQLIWLVEKFKNIAGYANDRDWLAVQEHLYEKLRVLNSDTVVKSPSAVTRLPGTKHRLSKNIVGGYLANEAELTLKDFIFFHELVPQADRLVKPKKANKQGEIGPSTKVTHIVKNWNEFTLNRYREEDLFTFVRLQNERKASYIGMRNWLGLILRFHALVSSGGNEDYARNRVEDLCDEMDMTETSVDEVLRRSSPAERYYKEWINDTWDRDKYVRGGLFYTNRRILELMNIEDDYYMQWQMKTIKIRDNKYEAARKRFEKFGAEESEKHTWEAYQERRNAKLTEEKEDKLWLLEKAIERHPEATQKELAKLLGWSQKTVSKWKNKM